MGSSRICGRFAERHGLARTQLGSRYPSPQQAIRPMLRPYSSRGPAKPAYQAVARMFSAGVLAASTSSATPSSRNTSIVR